MDEATFQTMVSAIFAIFYRPIVIGLTIVVGLSVLLAIAVFALMIIRPRIVA